MDTVSDINLVLSLVLLVFRHLSEFIQQCKAPYTRAILENSSCAVLKFIINIRFASKSFLRSQGHCTIGFHVKG